jgi:hypothetical protein
LLLSPNVIWALIPAVASTLENAVFAFNLIKKPSPTHNTAHIYYHKKLSLLALHVSSQQSVYVELIQGLGLLRILNS